MNTQTFAFAKQFADNAFKAQAIVLKSFEQAANLQLKALEQQSKTTAAFVAEAMEARDFDAARALWEKGVTLNRDGAERAVAVNQELMGIAQNTAETLGSLSREQQAAGVAAAASTSKKAAR
ncbi:MAG TPA: phasin family protein [Oleiagrimonas sp.]|jgi:hypothetical protein|nr:phasin family protein [Oleiagrimonas sp.]